MALVVGIFWDLIEPRLKSLRAEGGGGGGIIRKGCERVGGVGCEEELGRMGLSKRPGRPSSYLE